MRRTGTETGLLGFCRQLTREVLQLADPLRLFASCLSKEETASERLGNAERSFSETEERFFSVLSSLRSRSRLSQDDHSGRRLMQIEQLEVRDYFSGVGVISTINPIWFQEVAEGAKNHAGSANWNTQGLSSPDNSMVSIDGACDTYDWIVQFKNDYLGGIGSVAETVSLLMGSGIEFQAIRGLGIAGQVLLRSSGASFTTVEQCLRNDFHVAAFEQDALREIQSTPNDSQVSQLWGMGKIDAYSAWNITTGSSGLSSVVVADIDTGVDYTHPDLAANIWTNPNANRDGFYGDIHGYDFANNDGDPMDDNNHGTHVAGTIGAVGNNGQGVVGVNWAVSIMPLKFMTGSGSGYLSDAVRAINYATMQRTQYGVNVRVINASWGGGGYSSAMQTAIQAAGNAGILFVAAAGNDANNNDSIAHFPSNYDCSNLIAVAATDQYDRLASFSCYGVNTVDLAAPGVSIYSTLPGGRYGAYSGTSMATPHVAGAAALAWALNPNATVAEIRSALLQGVDQLSTLSGKVFTGGRLNVNHTLQLLQASTLPRLGSFSLTSSFVIQGSSVDLIAAGASASTGSITAIQCFQDTNRNGVFDSGDNQIGSSSNPAGGSASWRIATDNLSLGSHTFFARALSSEGDYSAVASVVLNVGITGIDTIGVYNPQTAMFYLRSSNNNSFTTNPILYGNPNWVPLSGDWDGDGKETIGLYVPSSGIFYLKGANDNSATTTTVYFGGTGWLPIVGDWTGEGKDSIGVYNPTTAIFKLRTSLDNPTVISINYGNPNWVPIAGDWDGDGKDTIGVYNPATAFFYLKAANDASYTTTAVIYGNANWTPMVGDWNGDGKDTIGVYDPKSAFFYLKYANDNSSTTTSICYGNADWKPIIGKWSSSSTPPSSPTSPNVTSIASGATLSSKLDSGGTENWYQFQAVAGTSYSIRTELVSLRDSVLHLYDTDGKTLLVSNDDGDSGLASQIKWTAPKSGTFFFKVSAYDKALTGEYRVSLSSGTSASATASMFGAPMTSNAVYVGTFSTLDHLAYPASFLSNRFSTPVSNLDRVMRSLSLSNTANASPFNSLRTEPLVERMTDALSACENAVRAIASDYALGSVGDRFSVDSANTWGTSLEVRANPPSGSSSLARYSAFRSNLGQSLFDHESDQDPLKSVQIDLDTLDNLFAQWEDQEREGE